MPLVIDDPLDGLAWSEKAPVLELLGRLSAHHQLVLVTADEEVLSWARLEAMAGIDRRHRERGSSPAAADRHGERGAVEPASGPSTHVPDVGRPAVAGSGGNR